MDATERLEFAGRVLDPDGKLLAGAKLHMVHLRAAAKTPPVVRATTDSQGRFHFTIGRRDFDDESFKTARQTAQVVAIREGFGLGWSSSPAADGVDLRDLTIRLTRDDVPILGTVVDLQGRPVAGAKIREQQILETENGDLSAWLDVCKQTNGGSQAVEQLYLKRRLWPGGSGLPAATTDAQGRFTIRGVGRERLIRLRVEAPVITTRNVGVLTRRGDPIRVNRGRGNETRLFELVYGAQFSYAAEPAKPVIGTVKDRDTGTPLAGVRIACEQAGGFNFHNNNAIETISDASGRYRLDGLPQHVDSWLLAIPARGLPYLPAAIEVPKATSLEPVTVDIGLKRGSRSKVGSRIKRQVSPSGPTWHTGHIETTPALPRPPASRRSESGIKAKPSLMALSGYSAFPDEAWWRRVAIPVTEGYLRGVGLPQGTTLEQLPVVPNYGLWSLNTLADVDLPRGAASIHRDLCWWRDWSRTEESWDRTANLWPARGSRENPGTTAVSRG